jgi:hypothetical protein
MGKATLDSRDSTPAPKVILDPLVVLLSARAVGVAKGLEKDLEKWEVRRGDWVGVP